MRISRYVRCVAGVLALSIWCSAAMAVTGKQTVAVSGEAVQHFALTLPGGDQQDGDTGDPKGTFQLTPDPDNSERSIAHINLPDAGDGLHLITNKTDGSVVWGGIVYGGKIVDDTVQPESGRTSEDFLLLSSRMPIRTPVPGSARMP